MREDELDSHYYRKLHALKEKKKIVKKNKSLTTTESDERTYIYKFDSYEDAYDYVIENDLSHLICMMLSKEIYFFKTEEYAKMATFDDYKQVLDGMVSLNLSLFSEDKFKVVNDKKLSFKELYEKIMLNRYDLLDFEYSISGNGSLTYDTKCISEYTIKTR